MKYGNYHAQQSKLAQVVTFVTCIQDVVISNPTGSDSPDQDCL